MNEVAFVAASAGTGKTYRVVTEVVAAITAGAIAPEALVATTFSRRAAASLRAALDRRLREVGRHDDALRLADARIGTVHSVCASLLDAFAYELGEPAGRRVAPPAAVDALRSDVLHEVVTDAELAHIDTLTARLVDFDPWRDAASLVSLARACGRSATEVVADALGGIEALDAQLGPVGDGEAILAAFDHALAKVPPGAVMPLVHDARQRRARASIPPWSVWSRLSSLDAGTAFDDALRPLRRAAADHLRHPLFRSDLRSAAELVSSLAARALAPFEARRRRERVVDYLDLESLALALLRRPDVRAALDGDLGLIVVDEFQDSSPLQLALFIELARIARRSLWVGDLKQSIYGFRGADPAFVGRVIAAITPASPEETLSTSWRSRGELVALSSGLFVPPFGAENIPASWVALTAAHTEDGSLGPAIERWRLPDGAERRAAALARGVQALLDDPSARVRDPRDGMPRRPRAGDVAVLARRHARCHAIAGALAALGIPCAYERAGLASTPEVRLALATLRLLVDADDRHAQAEVARLSAERPDDDAWLRATLQGDGALEDIPAVAKLRAAARVDGDLVAAWDRAVLSHGVRDHVRRWGDGAQRCANLDALRAMVVSHVAARQDEGRPASVPSLLLALRALSASGDDRCAVLRGEAVSVVTWHASKGLEWPVVVLVDIDAEPDAEAVFGARSHTHDDALSLGDVLATQRLTYWPSPYARDEAGALGARLVRGEGAAREARARCVRESLRELYVAFTRARDRVCLAAPSGRLTEGLMGLLRKEGVPLTPEPRGGKARWLRREWAVVERDPSGKALQRDDAAPQTAQVPDEGPAFAGPHAARWTLPSAQVAAGCVGVVERIGEAVYPHAAIDPRALGEMLHAWLASTVDGDAAAFLAAFCCAGALTPEELRAMRAALRGWCTRRFPDATAYAELPLTAPMPDGSTLRGSADLVLVSPQGFVVVDHKSHHGEGCEARAAEHWGQLRAYADALAEALRRPLLGCYIHLPLAGQMVQIVAPRGGDQPPEETFMSTDWHAKYLAHNLRLERPTDGVVGLARSIANARVDLNPHQVDAALFALQSPFSKGVLLADEVGLGKTIEAGIVIAQRWAEKKRRVLLLVLASLRSQWQRELAEKFFIPSVILETKTYNEAVKKGNAQPFLQDEVVIASHDFGYSRAADVAAVPWDLVVIDEAHVFRSIYKKSKKAVRVAEAIRPRRKLLLTATPLQNSLLELYGLVSILDPDLFGSQEAFSAQYIKAEDDGERNALLRDRLQHVYRRTLRRDVLVYINYTKRVPLTLEFAPSPREADLYERVSDYLQREVLVALPNRQRKLIQMILWKLLASSSRAIGATLQKFVEKLQTLRTGAASDDDVKALTQDFDAADETAEAWAEAEDDEGEPSAAGGGSAFGPGDASVPKELADLRGYIALAASIGEDEKTRKLKDGLETAFAEMAKSGGARKAVIFTESVKTQEYLVEWLSAHGYAGKIVVMNGTNADDVSKKVYADWKARHQDRWAEVSSRSRTADMKTAIVEAFRSDAIELLIATESAAAGINLQFCSVVVNYDLPWNPQRVEQRIGRCHRYGQKRDVLVVNFVNMKNEADRRVYELLEKKFELFEGVFGASDHILGYLESGVNIEQAIADIYQNCRTPEEIRRAFEQLQAQVEDAVRAAKDDVKQKVLDHLDEDVQRTLDVHKQEAERTLGEQQRTLLALCRHGLAGRAIFDTDAPRFTLPPSDPDVGAYTLDWKKAEAAGETFFRSDHPLAVRLADEALTRPTPHATLRFRWHPSAAPLGELVERAGWLQVSVLTLEAVQRSAQWLLLGAVTDDGTVLPEDDAARFFSLDAVVEPGDPGTAPKSLRDALDGLRAARVDELAQRNQEYFGVEQEKLFYRAEDLKQGLEREIKAIDKEITALEREIRRTADARKKLELQRAHNAAEGRRKDKRRALYDEQDRLDAERKRLTGEMEKALDVAAPKETTVFTLRWKLVR